MPITQAARLLESLIGERVTVGHKGSTRSHRDLENRSAAAEILPVRIEAPRRQLTSTDRPIGDITVRRPCPAMIPKPLEACRLTPPPHAVTRRGFLGRATAATGAAAVVLPEAASDAASQTGSVKKGLGQTVKHLGWARRLTSLRCKWFYSWAAAVPEGLPREVAFVPMAWGVGRDPQAITAAAAAAKQVGMTELLGFNEPDAKDQANLTVQRALDAWPLLMAAGMRLGSPSCVHPDREWMQEFMAGVKKRGLRVDFVCVHSYGGPNPAALIKRLEAIHRMFERPLWITEFAVGDWEAKTAKANRHRPDAVLQFMETVLPMLDRLDCVERYAWFPAEASSGPLGTSALFGPDGNLTRLGRCYRDA